MIILWLANVLYGNILCQESESSGEQISGHPAYQCMIIRLVYKIEHDYYVCISSFLSVRRIPYCQPGPTKWLWTLDGRWNSCTSLCTWEITKILPVKNGLNSRASCAYYVELLVTLGPSTYSHETYKAFWPVASSIAIVILVDERWQWRHFFLLFSLYLLDP